MTRSRNDSRLPVAGLAADADSGWTGLAGLLDANARLARSLNRLTAARKDDDARSSAEELASALGELRGVADFFIEANAIDAVRVSIRARQRLIAEWQREERHDEIGA